MLNSSFVFDLSLTTDRIRQRVSFAGRRREEGNQEYQRRGRTGESAPGHAGEDCSAPNHTSGKLPVPFKRGHVTRPAGAAPRGNPSETEPEQSHTAAGGGEEHSAGAAGGRRGGPQEPGEADVVTSGSGRRSDLILYLILQI